MESWLVSSSDVDCKLLSRVPPLNSITSWLKFIPVVFYFSLENLKKVTNVVGSKKTIWIDSHGNGHFSTTIGLKKNLFRLISVWCASVYVSVSLFQVKLVFS